MDYLHYIKKAEENIFVDVNLFWKHVNTQRNCNEYPNVMHYENKKLSSG